MRSRRDHSSFGGKRTVDDEERRGDMRGRLDAVEIKSTIGQRQHRGADDRRIFRTASGHHHVDRKHFAGECTPPRSHLALDELRIAAQDRDNSVNFILRRWNYRKTIRPPTIVVEFDEIRAPATASMPTDVLSCSSDRVAIALSRCLTGAILRATGYMPR